MEEILLALGLKSILSIILPIIVIIALIMIVSRLGDIRDDLKKIKKNIKSLRSRAEMQDTYESFDRDLSMSDEEKAIEKAKNKLFEHMQKEPEPEDSIFLQVAIGLLVIGFVLFFFIKFWIALIIFLLILAGIGIGERFIDDFEGDKEYQQKLERWKNKHEKLQKNLNDLRK